jgi:LuxR family maltose regulon positive regulatory protein
MELTFDMLTSRTAAHGALVERLHQAVRQIIEDELARAIEAASRAAPPTAAAATLPAEAATGVSLTSREREVLLRVAAGDSNKLIARALDLSPYTVKRHVANILGKLGVASRSQAAAWLHARH